MSEGQKTGPNWSAAGAAGPATQGISGARRVVAAHGPYLTAALENRLFSIDGGEVTITTAEVTGSAMGTAKYINGFLNPHNSGFNVAVLTTIVTHTSGTPGGALVYDMAWTGTLRVTSAATGTVRGGILNEYASHAAIRPLVGVVLATLPATTAVLTRVGRIGGTAAVALGAGDHTTRDDVDGKIVIPPGAIFGIAAVAVGTSHIVASQLYLEVLPIIPSGQ